MQIQKSSLSSINLSPPALAQQQESDEEYNQSSYMDTLLHPTTIIWLAIFGTLACASLLIFLILISTGERQIAHMGILAVLFLGLCGLLVMYWWREGGNGSCWELGQAEARPKQSKMN